MQLTKLLIALVTILVVASVATAKQANLRTQIAMRALETNAVSNASLITMGIIDGIASVAGNQVLCIYSHNNAAYDFVQGSHLIAKAFSNFPDPVSLENGLRMYGHGLSAVADSLDYCGLNNIVSNITKVVDQIKANPGQGTTNLVLTLIYRLNIIGMPDLIQQIKADLQAGQDYTAGVLIGVIVGTVLAPNVPDLAQIRATIQTVQQVDKVLPMLYDEPMRVSA